MTVLYWIHLLLELRLDLLVSQRCNIAEVTLTTPRIETNEVGDVDAFILLPGNQIETGQSRFVLTDQVDNTTISGVSDTNVTIMTVKVHSSMLLA